MNTVKTHLIHDRSHRGHTEMGWLNSFHTFSFGGFQDPNRMGFRSLRVINEDRVVPGAEFATHGHRDMEIISYVLEGALEHKDSMGNGSVIRPGDVQIMSAGTGIQHSEFNPSEIDPVHFLQIWTIPNQMQLNPRYEQRTFAPEERHNQLRLVVSPDGRNGSAVVYQDVELSVADLEPGVEIAYAVKGDRYVWLQVAQGIVLLNDEPLRAGDGVQIEGEEHLTVRTETGGEILLFDLG
jgi:hypothetical protein